MNGRRQALRAIFAAPAVAKAAVGVAAQAAESGVSLASEKPQNRIRCHDSHCESVAIDPIWKLYDSATDELHQRELFRRVKPRDIPNHIQSKVSWSQAFKNSVYEQETRELKEAHSALSQLVNGNLSTAQKLKKLAELGIDITGVKL